MDISLNSMRLAPFPEVRMYPAAVQTYFLPTSTRAFMSALKRTLASPPNSPRLTSRASHHNPAVTIFQLSSYEDDIEHSPRRSKRIKTRNITETEGQIRLDNLSHDVLSVKSCKFDADTTASGSALPSTSRPRDVRSSPKTFKAPHPTPTSWRETYDTIKDMRSRFMAPVDTMGCHMAQLKETDPKVIKGFFQIQSCLHSESTLF